MISPAAVVSVSQFILKKFLTFESHHGTDDRVAAVKAKAMEYVQQRIGGDASQGGV